MVFNMGDTITNRFERVSNSVYSCRWVELSPKLRKYAKTMLIVAQKPIYIQGFGNVRCTRETFKSVWIKYQLDKKFKYIILKFKSMAISGDEIRLYVFCCCQSLHGNEITNFSTVSKLQDWRHPRRIESSDMICLLFQYFAALI